MPITITAFENAPDGGRGLARDMPVRWALEEAGQAYAVRRVSFEGLREPGHLALQPFGQIPSYEEGELRLFESGAIVLHIAERHGGPLPADPAARARAVGWMFAAVSTLEPPIFDRSLAGMLEQDRPGFAERMKGLEALIRKRLGDLSARLGSADWLDGGFSAGDLMVVSVLRRLHGTVLLAERPNLVDYVNRGESRPAFQRAFAAYTR